MKVFSVSKYIEDMKSYGRSDSAIRRHLVGWAAECYGLTEEEMDAIGYVTCENWMEERKEEKEQ